MAELNVAIGTLTSKAEELEQLNATLDSMIKSLEETEAALLSMWDGSAKAEFDRAFKHDMVNLRNFYNAIIAYINALRNAISRYVDAENRNIEIARTRTYG